MPQVGFYFSEHFVVWATFSQLFILANKPLGEVFSFLLNLGLTLSFTDAFRGG